MATVRSLLTGAARLLGVAASGEALDASQAMDALGVLNGIVAQWNLEELTIPGVCRVDVTCTPGKALHTFGTGGDFNAARPERIENASVSIQGQEEPLQILSRDEWVEIPDKDTAGQPMALYYDPTFPLGSVHLWPVPSQAFGLALWAWDHITEFAHLDDEVSLPPAYEKALRFTLAVEWAPEFGLEASATVVDVATSTKAAIKRSHLVTPTLECDPGVLSGCCGSGLAGFLGGC